MKWVNGLAFDRIFMITEPDGTFITARQFPQMVRFTPSPVHDLVCIKKALAVVKAVCNIQLNIVD